MPAPYAVLLESACYGFAQPGALWAESPVKFPFPLVDLDVSSDKDAGFEFIPMPCRASKEAAAINAQISITMQKTRALALKSCPETSRGGPASRSRSCPVSPISRSGNRLLALFWGDIPFACPFLKDLYDCQHNVCRCTHDGTHNKYENDSGKNRFHFHCTSIE
jgi:hypothetical protein